MLPISGEAHVPESSISKKFNVYCRANELQINITEAAISILLESVSALRAPANSNPE